MKLIRTTDINIVDVKICRQNFSFRLPSDIILIPKRFDKFLDNIT